MINELQISNFRGITDLKLSGMKRVNLIVGANNSGKTSLLEAVALPMTAGKLLELPTLFRPTGSNSVGDFEKWMITKGATRGEVKTSVFGNAANVEFGSINQVVGTGARHIVGSLQLLWNEPSGAVAVHAIPVQHSPPEDMIAAFADTVRSPKSEEILERILREVDPRIRSIRLDFSSGNPFISTDVGLSERVPLSQAGQGIYRLVSILSELLGKLPKICLIDEIENGIHWTALPIVWQGIAEIAEALDIQVFATTHSRECLTAAYEVFSKRASPEAMDFSVIQLMRVKDKIEGRVLNGAHVEAAIENDIELR